MERAGLWSLLRAAAEQLGLEVRLDALDGGEQYQVRSGVCRLGPRMVAFIDKRADENGRCRQLGRALLGLDLEGVYLRPAVRQFLEELARAKED